MAEIAEIVRLVKEYVSNAIGVLFNGQVPGWIQICIALIVIVLALGLLVWVSFLIVARISVLFVQHIRPLFYNQEQRLRKRRMQRFAGHIKLLIERLNSKEDWRDYLYTELEAEVDVEYHRRDVLSIIFARSSPRSVKRVSSLSKALNRSHDKVILLQGEPGTGKSVALRHTALTMSIRASKVSSLKAITPLYVNLKYLHRQKNSKVDSTVIHEFVLSELTKANDRDVEEFLSKEFEIGKSEGRWLFLFDSFDEIPEILSSTESDNIVTEYGDAISDFLSGMNSCRGVIASRYYHGPRGLPFPRFRVQPLSSHRQKQFVKRVELDTVTQYQLIKEILTAPRDLGLMLRNPLFLGIACEEVRRGKSLPTNTYGLLASYFESRLASDENRVINRFDLKPIQIRNFAEQVSYALTSNTALGLSASREDIIAAMSSHGPLPSAEMSPYFDAMEYLKIGRTDNDANEVSNRSFSFSHRRFQEYFVTRFVISHKGAVGMDKLLLQAEWRETAVTLLQTSRESELEEVWSFIRAFLIEVYSAVFGEGGATEERLQDGGVSANSQETTLQTHRWPRKALHVLRILQAGACARRNIVPEDIRGICDKLIGSVWVADDWVEQMVALSVVGCCSDSCAKIILKAAFVSDSHGIRCESYEQLAAHPQLGQDLDEFLIRSIGSNRLRGQEAVDHSTMLSYLQRLPLTSRARLAERLMWLMPKLDLILLSGVAGMWLALVCGGTPFLLDPWSVILSVLLIVGFVTAMWRLTWRTQDRLMLPLAFKSDINGMLTIRFLGMCILLFVLSEPVILIAGGLLVLFLTWCIMWMPAAYMITMFGECRYSALLTIAPIVIVVRGLLSISILKAIINDIYRNRWISLLLVIALIIAYVLHSNWYWLCIKLPIVPLTLIIAWPILKAVYLVLLCVFGFYLVFRTIEDVQQYRRLRENISADIDEIALAALLKKFIVRGLAQSVLRRIIRSGHVLPTKNNLEAAHRLVQLLEPGHLADEAMLLYKSINDRIPEED